MLLKHARLIDPASGHDGPSDLRIQNGVIADIAHDLTPEFGEDMLDLEGLVLAPALIDMRAWVNPQSRGSAGLETTKAAAAAGGVGTLVLAPDSGNGLSRPEDFVEIGSGSDHKGVRILNSGLVIDHDGEMGEIGLMIDAGAAWLGDGGYPIRDTRLARRVLTYASGFETWISLSCEDHDLARGTCASESDLAMRMGLASRPTQSERIAVDRGAALAELTGAPILFDRLTTQDGLNAVRHARSHGLELAVSTPLTHLMFNEIDIGQYDARYRLDPPLRSEEDRLAILNAISTGDIDVIVSDHRACKGEDKAHPFPEAKAGSSTLEYLLPALMTIAQSTQMSWLDILRPVTVRPAEILGLETGRLTVGRPADLVVFDAERPFRPASDGPVCAASSAFENRRLFSNVRMTLVDGEIVYKSEGL